MVFVATHLLCLGFTGLNKSKRVWQTKSDGIMRIMLKDFYTRSQKIINKACSKMTKINHYMYKNVLACVCIPYPNHYSLIQWNTNLTHMSNGFIWIKVW